jgi:hypothetical protein
MRVPPSKYRRKVSLGAHQRSHGGLAEFPVLAVFSAAALQQPGRRPQNGSARTDKLNHFSVCCGNRSNQNWLAGTIVRAESAGALLVVCSSLCENFAEPWRNPILTPFHRFCLAGPQAVQWCSADLAMRSCREYPRSNFLINTTSADGERFSR